LGQVACPGTKRSFQKKESKSLFTIVYHPFKVESGGFEHHVTLIPDNSLVVIVGETVIFFQVSDYQLYTCSLAEALVVGKIF
jgi:hypothetical protein